tara:strand:+ start:8829 stop:9182 length:354 start_codon:yes stop_codon:yes gene_type:complete
MDYTNARYIKDDTIQTDSLSVPVDASNRHYAEMMELVKAGKLTIAPYVPTTQAELDAEQQAQLDGINDKVMGSDLALKAFALIVLDEINGLRAAAGLVERTPAQLKAAHRAKLNSIS